VSGAEAAYWGSQGWFGIQPRQLARLALPPRGGRGGFGRGELAPTGLATRSWRAPAFKNMPRKLGGGKEMTSNFSYSATGNFARSSNDLKNLHIYHGGRMRLW